MNGRPSRDRVVVIIDVRGVLRFVHALHRRHAIHRRSTSRILDLVLRHTRPAITLWQIYHRCAALFTPRIALTIEALHQFERDTAEKRAAGSAFPLARTRSHVVFGRHFSKAAILRREVLLQCLIIQRKRIETSTLLPDTQPLQDSIQAFRARIQASTDGYGSPRKVLRQSLLPEFEKENAISRSKFIARQSETVILKHNKSRPQEPEKAIVKHNVNGRGGNGDVDIKRLTDQVIHAIDRRIVAQRERTGRV